MQNNIWIEKVWGEQNYLSAPRASDRGEKNYSWHHKNFMLSISSNTYMTRHTWLVSSNRMSEHERELAEAPVSGWSYKPKEEKLLIRAGCRKKLNLTEEAAGCGKYLNVRLKEGKGNILVEINLKPHGDCLSERLQSVKLKSSDHMHTRETVSFSKIDSGFSEVGLQYEFDGNACPLIPRTKSFR